jgi:hypothetical protein
MSVNGRSETLITQRDTTQRNITQRDSAEICL